MVNFEWKMSKLERPKTPTMKSRLDEKNALIGLNNRLANILQRKQELEDENSLLSKEVTRETEYLSSMLISDNISVLIFPAPCREGKHDKDADPVAVHVRLWVGEREESARGLGEGSGETWTRGQSRKQGKRGTQEQVGQRFYSISGGVVTDNCIVLSTDSKGKARKCQIWSANWPTWNPGWRNSPQNLSALKMTASALIKRNR